jgi:son of sevenless-like protein
MRARISIIIVRRSPKPLRLAFLSLVSFWFWFIATAGYLFSSTGVFLTTLTFIQDGSKDTLPGNLVNFRKRQKASEVIQNIQRWQTFPHNFNPISSVQTYLEESLAKFNEQVDVGDFFWNLSLEREPREREDEKMARLLQESGFL